MKKKCYITTPAYYPSANAHIGHAYATIMSDIYARYKRLRGVETYFLTGTDEHGLKIENKAKENNMTPKQFVDMISDKFKNLWQILEISYDKFIRTTDEYHMDVVRNVFSKMLEKGDIYLGLYQGWYCQYEEAFWTETQVEDNHLCPECGRELIKASEDAYFYKTKNHLEELLKYLDTGVITPNHRKNEMINSFIKPGLQDLCVTRTSFKWGVDIKENKDHVIYVWLDALFNYLTALGYGTSDDSLYQKFWNNDDVDRVHILGADISRFHAIYWPEFLMSLDIKLPTKLFVHGLLMTKDGKMSKSKGNVISPIPLVERYGNDVLRYYFAREINFGDNGQFAPDLFIERANIDLVNTYGNLLSRTVSMIIKYFDGVIPEFATNKTSFDGEIDTLIHNTIANYENKMEEMNITEAISDVMVLVNRANKYIEETTPWTVAKDEARLDELKSIMSHLARILHVSSTLLEPILIHKAEAALQSLGVDKLDYESIKNENYLNGRNVVKQDSLFPRYNEEEEVNFILEQMKNVL